MIAVQLLISDHLQRRLRVGEPSIYLPSLSLHIHELDWKDILS